MQKSVFQGIVDGMITKAPKVNKKMYVCRQYESGELKDPTKKKSARVEEFDELWDAA